MLDFLLTCFHTQNEKRFKRLNSATIGIGIVQISAIIFEQDKIQYTKDKSAPLNIMIAPLNDE